MRLYYGYAKRKTFWELLSYALTSMDYRPRYPIWQYWRWNYWW